MTTSAMTTSTMTTRPVDRAKRLTRVARAAGIIGWSAFLSAAVATMLCFAFVDPQALRSGQAPEWWSSRTHVYALGFFFFWLIGAIAAAICWQLTHGRRDE